MAKRSSGILFSGLLKLRAISHKTHLVPARALSTIRKMSESCDLFEYTSGRWMYVVGCPRLDLELFD